LILDIEMSGQDGLSYLRELMESHRDLPVVISSAYPATRTTSRPGWRRPTWSSRRIWIPSRRKSAISSRRNREAKRHESQRHHRPAADCRKRLGTEPRASFARQEAPGGWSFPLGLEWGRTTLSYSQTWLGSQSHSQAYLLKDLRAPLASGLTFNARFGLGFSRAAA